ncbi:MAG: low temperature requirement protein A [Gemmatimonadota bacterium]|nr:low temperature requirement protein A [Gemmatimonadota bacterium]
MGDVNEASIVSPDDQSVTFVELFFDLVFVFSVTQSVGYLHHHLDWVGVGQTVLLFWLVWWAWTQFTWALNAADTTHAWVELATLLATGVAFFMAVAVPGAFGEDALWFALPYVAVRVIGLGLYMRVAWAAHAGQHAAVRSFALMSVGGLVAVIGGAIAGGTTQIWLWGLAILLDVISTSVAGDTDDWDLHPEHFAERHGLIVIIALGESLIVAAAGLTSAGISGTVLLIGGLAVTTTCALWWTYFGCAKPTLDRELEHRTGSDLSKLGRDVFSLLHFPLVLGVIGLAAAIEEIVLHPSDPLDLPNRVALATGIFLFTGVMALALWRASGRVHALRLVLALATGAAIVSVAGVTPAVTLGIATIGVTAIGVVEHHRNDPVATL